jgi:hypothetical protein
MPKQTLSNTSNRTIWPVETSEEQMEGVKLIQKGM